MVYKSSVHIPGGAGTVSSVTGLNTNNSDPSNPVVQISVDGTTITGAGTPASPLVAVAGGVGTVTSVSGTNANGVAFSISSPTTTPNITISLGAITPTSVVATGNVTGSNLSGTNTGDQVVPANTTGTTHQFFTAYNSTTGAFTKAQPASGDVSGLAASATTDTTTTANITDSANKRFITDAQQTVLGNTSGTNTGDQTSVSGNAGTATKWATARNLAGNSVDGSANVAFANKFIVQGTADAGLSGAQFLGALGTGIVKNTTTTGVLSIAVAGDFPTLNQNTSGSAATLTTGRTISISGDLVYTSPSFDGSGNVTAAGTLATVNSNTGSFGSSTSIPSFTVNGKGLITAASSNVVIAPASTLSGTTLNSTVVTSSLTSVGTQAQALNMGSHLINNVTDPASAQDAATKNYVDTVAQGLSVKQSARLATAAALPSNTYNNGASGVGATLTGVATGVLTVDGVTVALNDRIIVKNEVTGANNGLYVCTLAGAVGVAYVLTRSTDADTSAKLDGAFVFVESGTANTATGWVIANSSVITIGTTTITWTQFSGAGTYTNGAGLTLNGNQFSIGSGQVTNAMLANGAVANLSGTNTGDQTITLTGAVTGSGTGSFATTIATPGTLTVASTNSTATAHTHAITSSSAPGASASLLATDASGIIGSTGTRIVKIWATDLTVTNAIAGSITGNAATVTTNANLTGAVTSTGNATILGSFTSAALAGALTDETGSGAAVFATSPTLVTPLLGTPTSGVLTNCSGLTTAGLVNAAVTYAKIQNESAVTLLGNPTGGTASPSEITLGTGLSFSGTALTATGLTINTTQIDQTPAGGTYGTLAGTVNGSNAVFTVSNSAYVSGSLILYLNGQELVQGASYDWVETSPAAGTITFNVAPPTGSRINASYIKTATSSGTGNAPVVLSTTAGIDGKAVANTSLYTVPTGKTAVITGYSVRCTAASSISSGSSAGIGNVSGTNNIVASQTMTALTTALGTFQWAVTGISLATAAGGVIYFNNGTGATGTSQTLSVDLLGYYL